MNGFGHVHSLLEVHIHHLFGVTWIVGDDQHTGLRFRHSQEAGIYGHQHLHLLAWLQLRLWQRHCDGLVEGLYLVQLQHAISLVANERRPRRLDGSPILHRKSSR